MDWSSKKRKPVVCRVNKAYNLLWCAMSGVIVMTGSVDKIWHRMRGVESNRAKAGLLTRMEGHGPGLLTGL